MSTIKALIKDAQDSSTLVSVLLRKAKILATKLNQKEFLKWAEQELDGYPEKGDFPKYRKVSGQAKFWNPYYGWSPILFQESKDEKIVSSRFTTQSVTEIEELLNSGSKSFEMPYPASVTKTILNGLPFQTKAALLLDRSSLAGIINSVRNRILDWAIKLEGQGIQDGDSDFTDVEKEKAQKIDAKYKIGNIENFHGNLGDASEKMGIIIPQESLLSKFFWYVVVALVVVIIGNVLSALILKFVFKI